MKPLLFVLSLGMIFSLSACDWTGSVTPSSLPQLGQYDGFWANQEIQATLKQDPGGKLELDFPGQIWSFSIQGNGLLAQTPGGSETFGGPPDSQGCYSSKLGQELIQLCLSPDEIHWAEIAPDGTRQASLDLTRLLNGEMPTLETPQRYSLDDLVARAKKRNFQSVVAFQQMVMAKDQAINADLNLLPHGGAADVLNILSGSLFTELKSIGDLVPFLLPNHWFRAAAANDMAAAEKDSWEIMDLDGVNYVESFAYASARDANALANMGAERTLVASLRDFVRGKEQAGLAQVGSSDDLSSLVNKIDLSTTDLQALQSNELAALAQAAGFFNPQAITGVDFNSDPSSPSAGNPLSIDFASAADLAVSRSIELRQMDDLVAWAQNEAEARIFDWMDPSGDSDGGIGLGLPSYIQAGQDQVNVIEAQKETVKSDLMTNLQSAVLQLQKAAADYEIASQGVEIQERRVLRDSQNLKVGIGFAMSDLLQALEDQVNSQLARVDAQYGYWLALSRFNRILLEGPYADGGAGSQSAQLSNM